MPLPVTIQPHVELRAALHHGASSAAGTGIAKKGGATGFGYRLSLGPG